MRFPMKKQSTESCPTRKRFSVNKRKLIFSCIAICLFLLIVEACSFILLATAFLTASPWPNAAHLLPDENLGWTLTPNVTNHVVNHTKKFDVIYRTNKFFRQDGQDIRHVKNSDIVLIGDSHIFGFGLAENQTLSSQLHKMLSKNGDTKLVLNAGVPGYGLGQYYLRLQSLGDLAKGTLVVVYVNPLNDLVNLSLKIDYKYPKPHASIQRGQLTYSKPLLYNPKVPLYFAPEFDRLNQVFSLPTPAPAPLIAHLSQLSPTIRLMRSLKEGSIRFRWSELAPVEDITPGQDGEKYEHVRQEQIRKRPLRHAARYWPIITKFESERNIAEETLRGIFRAMKKHVEKQGANLLVVVGRECYSEQAFWIRLSNILAKRFPEYEFKWTLARDIVKRAAGQESIATLTIEYPQERIESMYVPYDGHTSGDGFSVVASEIVKWMSAPKNATTETTKN